MAQKQGVAFGMLEPYDGKLSCTVLRGERGREAPDPPGTPKKEEQEELRKEERWRLGLIYGGT